MAADIQTLSAHISEKLTDKIQSVHIANGEITIEVAREEWHQLALMLRDDPTFDFQMLIDVCGVDYLHYGLSEWQTESATATGFERGVTKLGVDPNVLLSEMESENRKPRFGVVYHLLSLTQNQRLRVRVRLDEQNLRLPSVLDIWSSANWFEREAFDLFGIIFENHPDLRRILTDYGFVGHPFRKDFPLSGHVEVRYDAKLKAVIYQPVSIVPRILEPKVIRDDNRYKAGE